MEKFGMVLLLAAATAAAQAPVTAKSSMDSSVTMVQRQNDQAVAAAIDRLPSGYREGARKYIAFSTLVNQPGWLKYIQKQSDSKWFDIAITAILENPDGKGFLMSKVDAEPDAQLRATIFAEIGEDQKVAGKRPQFRLAPSELDVLSRHASQDSSADAALAALNALHQAHIAEEGILLQTRRKQADTASLGDAFWEQYAWYGAIRNPSYAYRPPPVFVAAPASQAIRVLAFGDFGTGSTGQIKDAAAMVSYHQQHPFDFGITLGDNFYGAGLNDPGSSRWKTQWEDLYGPMNIRFYPVFGNHDYDDPDSPAAELAYTHLSKTWFFPAAYYTFTAGPVQFFAIDNIRLTEAELTWLDSELAKSKAKWKIVYGHYHIYSATRGDNDARVDNLIGRLLPIMEKNHVQVYLNGHDHNMQEARTESPVRFFTCGAGGASLYEMQPTYKKSIFKDQQYGFAVVEADPQHLDVIFIDQDGKEVYRSHLAGQS
jgi:hypothetical protein